MRRLWRGGGLCDIVAQLNCDDGPMMSGAETGIFLHVAAISQRPKPASHWRSAIC
jgi:hypothetical protein